MQEGIRSRSIRAGPTPQHDLVLVGGGLANSLIALQLKRTDPALQVAVVDADAEPSPHTWCLFDTDVEGGLDSLPLKLDHVWPGYRVLFPGLDRRLDTPYGCLTGATLRRTLRETLQARLVVARATAVGPNAVDCEDGRRLEARLVIDGRGDRPSGWLDLAWQKFVGLELRLKRPHGLDLPIVMDATVQQRDGYRFFYVLPLAPDRLLIEDTRYSDGAALDHDVLEAEILGYARGAGWEPAQVVGREDGVLPILLGGDMARFWKERPCDAPQSGMRGAFFHPTTGYSFPDAVRVARLVAARHHRGGMELAASLEAASRTHWRRGAFYRLLNRMLYRAAAPDQRYRVLQRFYGLPRPLIERFYAGRTSLADRVRILSGRPPVPIWKALGVVAPRRSGHAAA